MKIGDVVWHRGAGRKATINAFTAQFAQVMWFDDEMHLCIGYINLDCIEKLEITVRIPNRVVTQVMQWNSI